MYTWIIIVRGFEHKTETTFVLEATYCDINKHLLCFHRFNPQNLSPDSAMCQSAWPPRRPCSFSDFDRGLPRSQVSIRMTSQEAMLLLTVSGGDVRYMFQPSWPPRRPCYSQGPLYPGRLFQLLSAL